MIPLFHTLFITVLLIMACAGTAALVVLCLAGTFRCPKCRMWHDSAEDEAACDGKDYL